MPSIDSTPSSSTTLDGGTPADSVRSPAAPGTQPVSFADDAARLAHLARICASAGFNRWAGFEVARASEQGVELTMPWRDEAGQYSGFLHAGLIGALLDTVCGFAAVARTGQRMMASHFGVNCLAPAVGARFVARGQVIKAGRKQVFTRAELYAYENDSRDGAGKLVATGEVILVPVSG